MIPPEQISKEEGETSEGAGVAAQPNPLSTRHYAPAPGGSTAATTRSRRPLDAAARHPTLAVVLFCPECWQRASVVMG
jgi:hypothetical protein